MPQNRYCSHEEIGTILTQVQTPELINVVQILSDKEIKPTPITRSWCELLVLVSSIRLFLW